MWTSKNIKLVEKKIKFEFDISKEHKFNSLFIDDLEFINMVEILDGEIKEDQVFQSKICEEDGIYHCEFGNWIAIRRCDEFILFLTAIEMYHENANEYFPPEWINVRGAFFTTLEEFHHLKKFVPEFEKIDSINSLTKTELIYLFKSDSTFNLFGDFPDFLFFNKSEIIAITENSYGSNKVLDIELFIDILVYKIKLLENSSSFKLTSIIDSDKILTLELKSCKNKWDAMVMRDDKIHLLLGGKIVILID